MKKARRKGFVAPMNDAIVQAFEDLHRRRPEVAAERIRLRFSVLEAARVARGWSQAEVCRRAGLGSASTYTDIKTGRARSLRAIRMVCRALRVKVSDVVAIA